MSQPTRVIKQPTYKLYIKQSDQNYHVLFYDNYGGKYGWHRNDDLDSASGFLRKQDAVEWADKRLKDDYESETA